VFDTLPMDRRSLLQNAFALVGAGAALSACDFSTLGSKGEFSFTEAQRALVSAIADTVVPKTDTPGALEAGVPKAFEGLLSNWANHESKEALLAAADKIDSAANTAKGKGFADLSPAERASVLLPIDTNAFKEIPNPSKSPAAAPAFANPNVMDPDYARLKSLLFVLYYTSEAALTQEVPYNHNPGKYRASMPVTAESRAESGGLS
jgi:gluconate 2-dehydrogenase gamma chain